MIEELRSPIFTQKDTYAHIQIYVSSIYTCYICKRIPQDILYTTQITHIYTHQKQKIQKKLKLKLKNKQTHLLTFIFLFYISEMTPYKYKTL